ncbi:MAG: aldehyde dehydrogenase (NADP(+)) [bacterium]|nr:aldehyde dehydrogenase (NADP(+)) [bacterium]
MSKAQKVLVAGAWRDSQASGTFEPDNPTTRQATGERYPVSNEAEVLEAIEAAALASEELRAFYPEGVARFLETYADRIEANADEIVSMAATESGLPAPTRLAAIELPRTTGQLRQAARAARTGSWCLPTIDTASNIRSLYQALEGGVAVFGPNNFPLAFNSVSGGDFAAAIGAGCPVIGKANSSHPGTSRLLAEEALEALKAMGLPPATVQLIYRTDHAVGAKLVSHARIGATGYTGSRSAGLTLKATADAAGKPIYLELSSINPVYILPGALQERGESLADDFSTSCLLGAGQFCTNPGIVVLLKGDTTDSFIQQVKERFEAAPVGTLLARGVETGLSHSVATLQQAGAELLTGGQAGAGKGFSFSNTLLHVTGATFLQNPEALQTEAFGNESLFIVADDVDQACAVARHFEGNLTGCIYSATAGTDDDAYNRIAPLLRRKVGRLLNDKMPTGVAVVPSMNHGGPYPATGHPGFTAVGIPASLRRFGMLSCYDNVRDDRLPAELRNKNPGGVARLVDGVWSTGDVPA